MLEDDNGFLRDFDLLTEPGVIGHFDHFELIEVVQFADGTAQPTNVFTIAVAIENGTPEKTQPLNSSRIRIGDLKGYYFGIFKSVHSTSSIKRILKKYVQNGIWQTGSQRVQVGDLSCSPKQFVPASSMTDIPLNRVLKNNFFSGSYVLELFDVGKRSQAILVKHPSGLHELFERVSEFVPLSVASLSDRLGNVVFQLPIEAIRVRFQTNSGLFSAKIAWHPKIQPRDLIVTAQAEFDNVYVSFGQSLIKEGSIALGEDPDHGGLNGFVWDRENNILLAATGEQSFIKSMSFDMVSGLPEPRVFPKLVGDKTAAERIKLSAKPRLNTIGKDPSLSIARPIGNRIYDDEKKRLAKRRQFVQYAAKSGTNSSERERALTDVRKLIGQHGTGGVWLWDPYLAPQDLLDTLFYNSTYGAPMRALTALKESVKTSRNSRPRLKSSRANKRMRVLKPATDFDVQKRMKKLDLLKSYRDVLQNLPGNYLGLNIEFRSAHGQNGWGFHDRFLIFPRSDTEPTKAWSLGTSVNSLGKSHHILQQVDNSQLIADAFLSLWSVLSDAENCIWSYR